MDEMVLRQQICDGAHQLWLRGLIAGDGGMLSAELGRRRYLATPAGRRRCTLAPVDLACVDVGGLDANGGPSIAPELWRPHRLAYQAARMEGEATDADISQAQAAILATPPSLLVLLRLRPGDRPLKLGASGSLAGTLPVVDATDDRALRHSVAVHGIVAAPGMGLLVAGADLIELLNRVESIEHAAAIELACLGRC